MVVPCKLCVNSRSGCNEMPVYFGSSTSPNSRKYKGIVVIVEKRGAKYSLESNSEFLSGLENALHELQFYEIKKEINVNF